MRSTLQRLVVLACALLLAPAAQAWNAAGHRLGAAIAWQQLDEATRIRLGHLLEQHPDYPAWIARAHGLPPAYAAFLEASTWPDDIRRDVRFHDEDEAPGARQSGFPDLSRHRDWHHVDRPIGHAPRKARSGGTLDLQFDRLQATLADHRQPAAARAYALPWLIHLVGDAHQPLHAVSRFDATGEGDDGGNALTVDNPFHPRRNSMSLHAYWDDLPGPPWLRGDRLETAAQRMMRETVAPRTAGTLTHWLDESEALARSTVYAGLDGEVPTLTAEYHERALRTARERVALSGHRLALLLRQLLAGD